jgi:predicted nucleic acid-binding protein
MIVLDAAAMVDVLIDRPAASWVLERLDDADVCAPGHQPAEVLSALSRLRRAGLLSDDAVRDAIDEFCSFPQELVWPSRHHLTRAFALSERIRVLDGLYVALAAERSCALVTTDRRLADAQAPCDVVAPAAP